MSAYLIVRVNIQNPVRYKQYLDVVPALIEKFGGKPLARAGETITLEGPQENRRIVLIEFPSMDRAKEFYNSDEYLEARKLRKDAAEGELIIVDGLK